MSFAALVERVRSGESLRTVVALVEASLDRESREITKFLMNAIRSTGDKVVTVPDRLLKSLGISHNGNPGTGKDYDPEFMPHGIRTIQVIRTTDNVNLAVPKVHGGYDPFDGMIQLTVDLPAGFERTGLRQLQSLLLAAIRHELEHGIAQRPTRAQWRKQRDAVAGMGSMFRSGSDYVAYVLSDLELPAFAAQFYRQARNEKRPVVDVLDEFLKRQIGGDWGLTRDDATKIHRGVLSYLRRRYPAAFKEPETAPQSSKFMGSDPSWRSNYARHGRELQAAWRKLGRTKQKKVDMWRLDFERWLKDTSGTGRADPMPFVRWARTVLPRIFGPE